MSVTVIRIPFKVENFHATAGFFTDGPSFSALYGLVSHLERESGLEEQGIEFAGFGVVVEHYKSSLGTNLKASLDALDKSSQASMPSMLPYRHGDLDFSLYLKIDAAFDESEQAVLVTQLRGAVNRARVQGGLISEFIGSDENPIKVVTLEEDSCYNIFSELALFIADNEKALSTVYASAPLEKELMGLDLIKAYAEELATNSKLLVCNGFVEVATVKDEKGNDRVMAEPCYSLAEIREVYVLKDMALTVFEDFMSRFFWKFDLAASEESPRKYIVR